MTEMNAQREHDAGDADLRSLRALPPREPDHVHADVLRRRALAAFDSAYAGKPWVNGAARLWSRVGVPAVLMATCAVYLTLAIRAASALYP